MAETKKTDISQCYGSLKIHISKLGTTTINGCGNDNCPWREPCISASRESLEAVDFQKRTVPLEDKISRIEYLFAATPASQRVDTVMEELGITEDQADALRGTVEILAMLYMRLPRIFDAAMRRIYKGENMSDIARLRGVTRQAVSKGGIADLAGIKDPLAFMPPELEGMELAVYDLCTVKKMTVRQAAEKLKISKTQVCRLGQKINSKLRKNGTRKNRKSKKNGKNL